MTRDDEHDPAAAEPGYPGWAGEPGEAVAPEPDLQSASSAPAPSRVRSGRRGRSISQSIGGVLFGFEQQVLRTTPPPQELVRHARPNAPVPAADGSLVTISLPDDVAPDPFAGTD